MKWLWIRLELVNQDPYGEGWLIVVKPKTDEEAAGNLLSVEEYIKQLKGK